MAANHDPDVGTLYLIVIFLCFVAIAMFIGGRHVGQQEAFDLCEEMHG